jgi:DNA-binding transcriptional MocR family regulator
MMSSPTTTRPRPLSPNIQICKLSLMLGVRRAGVTEALHALESKGLIRSRGAILVRNRKGIERSAGGTYGVPEKELRRLVGQLIRPPRAFNYCQISGFISNCFGLLRSHINMGDNN